MIGTSIFRRRHQSQKGGTFIIAMYQLEVVAMVLILAVACLKSFERSKHLKKGSAYLEEVNLKNCYGRV
jgi:hypothetical protein